MIRTVNPEGSKKEGNATFEGKKKGGMWKCDKTKLSETGAFDIRLETGDLQGCGQSPGKTEKGLGGFEKGKKNLRREVPREGKQESSGMAAGKGEHASLGGTTAARKGSAEVGSGDPSEKWLNGEQEAPCVRPNRRGQVQGEKMQ